MPRAVVPMRPAPPRLLASPVEDRVAGQQHVGAVGDEEAAVEAYTGLVEAGQLGEHGVGRHHHAVAQDADHVRMQDAGGNELQGEMAVPELDRVAGVVATLITHDAVEGRAEEIDDLPLPLVPPLHPDDDDVGHGRSALFDYPVQTGPDGSEAVMSLTFLHLQGAASDLNRGWEGGQEGVSIWPLRHRTVQSFLDVSTILLPLAYLLVAIDYAFLFFGSHPVAERTATPALRGVVLFHLAYLAALTFRWGQFPAATVSQALSIVAFAVAVIYVFVEWHGRARSTGFWLVSLVFFFQLLASMLTRPNPPDRAIFHDPFFAVHVSLALLGYAGFVVGAGYAFLFLQLYRDLKAGRFSTFYGKLPPLEVLEKMMLGALFAGFVSLTGAVSIGAVWADPAVPRRLAARPQDPDHLRHLGALRLGPAAAPAAPLAGAADGPREPRRASGPSCSP